MFGMFEKSSPRDNSYECINDEMQPNPGYMYCFRAKGTDGTASAAFTFFSPTADSLTNLTCEALAAAHPDPTQLPPEITSTIGNEYLIEFRYNPDSQVIEFIVDKILATRPTLTAETASGQPSTENISGEEVLITPGATQSRRTDIQPPTPITPTTDTAEPATGSTATASTQHVDSGDPPTGTKRQLFQGSKAEGKRPKPE